MTSRTQAALLGGLTIGLLSALPIIGWANCCCLWIVTGGLVAAYIQQQNQTAPLSAGDGAIAGLIAGFVGAVVYVVMVALVDAAIAPIQSRVVERLLDSSQDVPPEMRGWLQDLAQQGTSNVRLALGFVFMLCVGSIFSTMGGALGAIVFRPPVAPPPPPPPPPPVAPLPPDSGITPPDLPLPQ